MTGKDKRKQVIARDAYHGDISSDHVVYNSFTHGLRLLDLKSGRDKDIGVSAESMKISDYFVFDNFFSTVSNKQVKLQVKLVLANK